MGFLAWLRQQTASPRSSFGSLAQVLDNNTNIKTLRRLRFELALRGTPLQRATLEAAVTEWRKR